MTFKMRMGDRRALQGKGLVTYYSYADTPEADIAFEDVLNLVTMAGYKWEHGRTRGNPCVRIWPDKDDPLRFYLAEFSTIMADAQKAYGLLDTFYKVKNTSPKGA